MSTRYSKRFSRYVQPRPGLESAALALPLEIGAVPSLESLMEELTSEVSPGLEGLGDWIGEKLGKVSKAFTDLIDDFGAAYRKFKADDWTSLSPEDQLRIVKKAKLLYFAFHPEDIEKLEDLISATAELTSIFDKKKLAVDILKSEVSGPAKKIADAYNALIKSVTGANEKLKPEDISDANRSAGENDPIALIKKLGKLYQKALDEYKPADGKFPNPTVVVKLVKMIQQQMPKYKSMQGTINRLRDSAYADFSNSEQERSRRVEFEKILLVVVIISFLFLGPIISLVIILIGKAVDSMSRDPEDQTGSVEALSDSVLLDLHTGELSVGNEGFIDWTKDKFAKMKETVSETFDSVRLAYRQFKAKDWNDLSEADQIKIVKKAGLQFFYYNPKKLAAYEKFINAFGEFAKTNDAGLTETIDKCVVAIDGVLVAIGESKGPEVPSGDVVKMLSNSRLLHKKLKAWQPAEGAVGDATVVPKLLAMINEKLIPVAKRAESVSEKAAGVEAREYQSMTVGRVLGYILLVGLLNILGIIIVISLEISRHSNNEKVGNESFEDSNAVTLAADAATVSATDLQPGVEAEGDDEKADDTKVDESDDGDKANESEEDKSDSEDAPATNEAEASDDVVASDAADATADADEETAPVEIVDEITTTTEVDLDSDYVKEIEAVNAVEAETDEVESDTEELEEISSGLESLIDAMYETQLAGGMSNLQYRTTMQHGVHNYARRAGVTVRTPGVESLGDSVRGRMYLSKVGIESAEGVAGDVIEMLKNAWEQFRAMIADFFKRLFDHQSQLKEKLSRIKASVGTKRTGSVKIELPSGAASSLQYDGAVGPESVKKLAADCDALTRYLKSTNQLAKMLTTEVKVDNIEDGEYTEELNSKAQESLMLPLKELKMAGVEVVETDSADGAVKVEKAETLEATEVSSVDVAAVEQAVNAYNTLIDTWKADSRYLSISDKSTKGIWNLDSMKSLAGDALKRIKAYYRLFRAYLSGLGRRIAAARKGADAAVLYLELSSKAALQLPNKATA